MSERSPKGPLMSLAGKAIAKAPCPVRGCGKTVLIKINKAGWPYYSCPHCDYRKVQSEGGARELMSMNGIVWVKGMRAAVKAAWDAPADDPEEDDDNNSAGLEFEPDEPAPEPEPEPSAAPAPPPKAKEKRRIPTWFDDL